jgi:tetratricopeptide (TPR) repeat protein
MLATSRRVLHVGGEHVYPLEPLPVTDAATLFTDRMATAGRDGAADRADVIDTICQRLDCLPLAIELAAARTTTMAPAQLLSRLSERVAVLGVGPRDSPARQRTLADTVAWSTDLLSSAELRAFGRLSVFAGGSSLEAAEEVAETSADTIETLVDSSLVRRATVNGADRLIMLETIREHAAVILDDSERARAEAAHIAYYCSLAAQRSAMGPDALEDLALIEGDVDNFRAAYDRSFAAGDDDTALGIAMDLENYWFVRGHYREGCERMRRPLERDARAPARRADALRMLSWHAFVSGDVADSIDLATRSLELATASRNLDAQWGCHGLFGMVALGNGEFTTARRHFEQAHAIAVELGTDDALARTNSNLADLAMALGDYEQARQRWERNVGRPLPPWREIRARWGLGTIARRQGRFDEADQQFARSVELAEAIGYPHAVAVALVGRALVAADRGDAVECRLLLDRADAVLEIAGIVLAGSDGEDYREARRTLPSLSQG